MTAANGFEFAAVQMLAELTVGGVLLIDMSEAGALQIDWEMEPLLWGDLEAHMRCYAPSADPSVLRSALSNVLDEMVATAEVQAHALIERAR